MRHAILIACVLGAYLASIALAILVDGIDWGYADNAQYAAMVGDWIVESDQSKVVKPFADRVLAPLVARAVVAAAGVTPLTALAIVGGVAIFLTGSLLAFILARCAMPLPLAIAAAVMPAFAHPAIYMATVDGLFVLTALLLVVVATQRLPLMHVAVGLAAFLTRETSIALIPFLGVVHVARRTFLPLVLLVAAAVVALVLIRLAQPYVPRNVHDMSPLAYFAFKVPVNLVKNLTGLNFWTNGFAWCDDPVFTFDVGAVPGLGRITEVGLCRPEPRIVIGTLINAVCMFGAVPLLLWLCRDAIRERMAAFRRAGWRGDLALPVAASGFALLWVAAPGFGASANTQALGRLFVFALPLLVMTVIELAPAARRLRRSTQLGLLAVSLVLGIGYRLLPLGPP